MIEQTVVAQHIKDAIAAGATYIPTNNRQGYCSRLLDTFSIEFGQFASSLKIPVIELGAGYGFAIQYLLDLGVKNVFVNDIDLVHLKVLIDNIDLGQRTRLRIEHGCCVYDIDYIENSFGGALMVSLINCLKGNEIDILLEKLHKWLVPEGKVFIVFETIFLRGLQKFVPIYENKKLHSEKWPGEIFNFREEYFGFMEAFPDFFHVFDYSVVTKALKKAGFIVEKVNFINRTYFPKYLILDGRESIGIIARKAK